jgi:HKD family nuclease
MDNMTKKLVDSVETSLRRNSDKTSDTSSQLSKFKKSVQEEETEIDEKWSQKYKSSINCANPKGFSQRAHCAGRKK